MTERTIAEEIEELQRLPVAELVVRYEEMFGRPPRSRHRVWLWRKICWELQARKFGGLSEVAKRRLDELIAQINPNLFRGGETVREKLQRPTKPGLPPVGSALVRTWRGKELRVVVLDDGFEFGGVRYRSLSAVAGAVTGSHLSGPSFFGLSKRKGAK
jgi:hypothetical protein